MFASYCQALLLSLSIILSINNTRDRVEGESGERKRRKVGGRTGCIGGTMFIKEYIYTFIHGQPAFTEVTLIVDRRHSSPPALWREEMRDAQNKKDRPTPGSAARRQRADGRRFVKQARDAHGEHTPSFFYLNSDNHAATGEKEGLAEGWGEGLDSSCSYVLALASELWRCSPIPNLSVSETVAPSHEVDNQFVISFVIDAVVMSWRTMLRRNCQMWAPLALYLLN